jgi:hypothetical protein
MEDVIKVLLSNTATIATIVGALLTIAAGIASGIGSRQAKQPPVVLTGANEADHLRMRIDEVQKFLQKQESLARRNQLASSLLVFGQYVIGGALASSFVQESLSRQIVGTLGVLVLLSSLIHQRYRPDIKIRGARDRVLKLRSLIRYAQDEYNSNRIGRTGADSLDKIIRRLSRGLTEIEATEVHEFDELNRETKALSGGDDA